MRTHEFLRSIPVDYLHVFTYSERANTTAVRMLRNAAEDAIPMEVRRERTKQLRILSSKMQRAFYQRHQGTVRPVLFEQGEHTSAGSDLAAPAVHATPAGSPPLSEDPAEKMEGYTDNYIRVTMPHDPALVNIIVPVNLKKINSDGHMEGSLENEGLSTLNTSASLSTSPSAALRPSPSASNPSASLRASLQLAV